MQITPILVNVMKTQSTAVQNIKRMFLLIKTPLRLWDIIDIMALNRKDKNVTIQASCHVTDCGPLLFLHTMWAHNKRESHSY